MSECLNTVMETKNEQKKEGKPLAAGGMAGAQERNATEVRGVDAAE